MSKLVVVISYSDTQRGQVNRDVVIPPNMPPLARLASWDRCLIQTGPLHTMEPASDYPSSAVQYGSSRFLIWETPNA
jgi:hypothetical protein